MAVYTTIDDPSKYFQTLLYTGDGGSDRTINFDGNSDLQPDFLWVKKRSATQNHYLANTNDSISKVMYSNDTGVEANETAQFKSVHSDGWVQGVDNTNTNTATFVAWGWKANGGSTSSNTSGTNIDTTVQANTTAGFSIMTYEGTGTAADSIGHGLGAVPHLVIVKNREEANRWTVYHHKNTSAPETEYLNLQDLNATVDVATRWNDTAPTSTVITLGDNDGVSKASTDYVCYAWTSIQGYSQFGGYIGNGSTDGKFVFTGFKVGWLLIKNTQNSSNWRLWDNRRTDASHNEISSNFRPNSDGAETTDYNVDFLSNGWKARVNDEVNNDTQTFIYAAFAESPLVTSTGIPATAS